MYGHHFCCSLMTSRADKRFFAHSQDEEYRGFSLQASTGYMIQGRGRKSVSGNCIWVSSCPLKRRKMCHYGSRNLSTPGGPSRGYAAVLHTKGVRISRSYHVGMNFLQILHLVLPTFFAQLIVDPPRRGIRLHLTATTKFRGKNLEGIL